MTESTLERIRQVAADTFNVTLDEVTPASSPDTVANWDSLQLLNLILELESAFAVRFSPQEIEQMNTIEAIAGLVDRKLSRRDGIASRM